MFDHFIKYNRIIFPFILRKEGVTSENLVNRAVKNFTKLYMISLWIKYHKKNMICLLSVE